MYMDQSNPTSSTGQHEAKLVGGGSAVNVGAWLRPRSLPDTAPHTARIGLVNEAQVYRLDEGAVSRRITCAPREFLM